MSTTLVRNQKKVYGPRFYTEHGTKYRVTATVRYDDQCGSGHNSFAITGSIDRLSSGHWRDDAGGCIHEEIAKHFPELAPFIKWHLMNSDGPWGYIANTVYFAGDRDCWGKRKGEPKAWEVQVTFGDNPIQHKIGDKFAAFLQTHKPLHSDLPYDFEVLPIAYDNKTKYNFAPKYTFGGFADKWHDCPFNTEDDALRFLYALNHCSPKFTKVATAWGNGKERELDKARSAAIWPDATDEELTAPGLKERLEARLPALIEAFKADLAILGLTY